MSSLVQPLANTVTHMEALKADTLAAIACNGGATDVYNKTMASNVGMMNDNMMSSLFLFPSPSSDT
jgi:hypothetical protein